MRKDLSGGGIPARETAADPLLYAVLPPATLRLLDTYSALEAQRVRGETIDEAMRGVEEMAGTLAEAFKKQLDRLFTGEALDVSAEIRVLETMLRRDGLMGDDPFSAPPDTKDL